jgi:hypothetical protein
LELQIQKIRANPQAFEPVHRALVNHRNHAALGSIGPDMLFWADWGHATPVVNTIFDIYKTIDEVYEALSAIWKPIGDAIDKEVDTLTGGLAGEISETLNLAKDTIVSALMNLITQQIDILELYLKPDMQEFGSKSNTKNWNWLDYTHHRWTGVFGKTLITLANQSGDPALRAYAYGWLSHITADVVGHAYVNTAVGGPWRSHWQRHFIQEKFMDTWVWGFYHPGGISMPTSVNPGEIPFDYSKFQNVNGASLHKRIDLGSDLPDNLQGLIAQALLETYGRRTGRNPPNVKGTIPFLQKEHINRAYQMLFTALEMMTSEERFLSPPEPPSVFNDFAPPTFPMPGGSGSGSGGSSGGSFSLLALLMAIVDFILDQFSYLHDLAQWLISQATFPLTYPLRLGLYMMQLGLYGYYRVYRWALSLSGYVFPDPDQLWHPLAQQFINPFGWLTPGEVRDLVTKRLPRREFRPEQHNCINFPTSLTEGYSVSPGPYTRQPLNYPFWFIEGEPSHIDIDTFERALANAKSPEVTDTITEKLFPDPFADPPVVYNGSLGSAVDFFLRRATEIAADNGGASQLLLPNWNLDADRGYGSLCWEVVKDANNNDTMLEPPPLAPPAGVIIGQLPQQ